MIHHLNVDIETYSDIDLKHCGLYRYAQSPAFQVMLFGCSWDGKPVDVYDLTEQYLPPYMPEALADPNVIKHAYNAAFEWYCLNRAGVSTPIHQWRCTMAHGLYCGYPDGLGKIGDAMGLPTDLRKLSAGKRLIGLFCKPCKPTRNNGMRSRTLPQHEPEQWVLFKRYNAQDVVAEMNLEQRLSMFPMPENEQRLWELDQLMAAYGAAVDREMVEGALYCSEITSAQLMEEATRLSGLDNPNSTKQLKAWLEEELDEEYENGLPDVNKKTIASLLRRSELDDTVRRMLEIRRELAKTSVKKYYAMRDAVGADGRVRGMLQYYGANRTGRYAGRIVQIQNLPQNHLPLLETARELVKGKRLDAIKLVFGNVPDTLSQLIRTAFIPSPGNRLLVADFSAIEARVIAWLAGEQWVMDVFATHGRIYEAQASQMFGVAIDDVDKDLRQKGKVATLALGYQGSTGALINMGALDKGLTEDELPEIVQRWRQANRRIVDLWYTVERAVVACLQTGAAQMLKHDIVIRTESHSATGQGFLTIQLPSGRRLYYAQPRLEDGVYGPRMTYMGVDQKKRIWTRLETYGGKLVENLTQAIARDCLTMALQKAVAAGYPVVFHVHDELIADAPPALQLQPLLDIMAEPIPWAPGLLLKGAGFETNFYKKDD